MRKDDHLIFEAFQNKLPGAGPDAALRNTGAGENAEGMSDAEYHKARKDAFEGAGEELGHGPIKVQLNKDTRLDCYKSGTVQEVRFSKGTIFNCDENVGDYYECDTEEYGGIAVFPDDVTVLSGEENAEHVPLTLGKPDPALKNTGPGENAEGSIVKEGDFFEADGEKYVCVGVENAGGKTVVHGQMLAEFGDTFPIEDVVKID
jgi:hypothetical protein